MGRLEHQALAKKIKRVGIIGHSLGAVLLGGAHNLAFVLHILFLFGLIGIVVCEWWDKRRGWGADNVGGEGRHVVALRTGEYAVQAFVRGIGGLYYGARSTRITSARAK
jgi:hypothetical protein